MSTSKTSEGEAPPASAWGDTLLAATLLAIDPCGLGGVVVRARASPVRDHWMSLLRSLVPAGVPMRRVPLAITDHRLLGGLDLAATLQAGQPVVERGVLCEAHDGLVILAMAERLGAGEVARMVQVVDRGEVMLERDGIGQRFPAQFGMIGLDEGADEDEKIPAALADRMALRVDLTLLTHRDVEECDWTGWDVKRARSLLGEVVSDRATIEALCATAAALGIDSVRAPMLALKAARAAAALEGRVRLTQADAIIAGRLVLAPRATILPMPEQDQLPLPEQDQEQKQELDQNEAPEPPQQDGELPDETDDTDSPPSEHQTLEDVVLNAALAAIPAGLLARLRVTDSRVPSAKKAGKEGAMKNSGMRGRPVGVRRGMPRPGMRLNVIATLRAAAPWQKLRRGDNAGRIHVLADDFHVTRIKQRSATVTIFAVDASGSSALNRLAEAKGAVELLLADCYIRRDQVAVISFRGKDATLILPPTRSLARAKRAMAELAGGGGTPLASGLDVATALAMDLRQRGLTPIIVLMTDGAANVGRDGRGGRTRANEDAMAAGRALRLASLSVILIDTAPRPQASAQALAREMAGLYIALPQANAQSLTLAVRSAAR